MIMVCAYLHLCVLLQAVDLLAELLPARSHLELWCSDSRLAIMAAAAASFLLNLLDMHCIRLSPMSMQSPHNFMWLGIGQS